MTEIISKTSIIQSTTFTPSSSHWTWFIHVHLLVFIVITIIQQVTFVSTMSITSIPNQHNNNNNNNNNDNNMKNVRIELFFKDEHELSKRMQFLSSSSSSSSTSTGNPYSKSNNYNIITSFNIVNKSRQDTMKEWVTTIHETLIQQQQDQDQQRQQYSICAHYSLKFNKSTSRSKHRDDESYQKFISFLQSLPTSTATSTATITTNDNSNNNNISICNEVLLISGSGDKATLDTINVLQRLQNDYENNNDLTTTSTTTSLSSTITTTTSTTSSSLLPDIAIAYNPFFPLEKDISIEKQRLIDKLNTNQVNKIYIQFGTNLNVLQSTLKWLINDILPQYCQNTTTTNNNNKQKRITICGSIFLPTKKLIAQQKFRPWNGVYLSQEFLNSPHDAYQIVVQMMKLYQKFGCEILIEAPGVRNEKDMDLVQQLLKDRDTYDDDDDDSNNDDNNNDNNNNNNDRHIGEEVKMDPNNHQGEMTKSNSNSLSFKRQKLAGSRSHSNLSSSLSNTIPPDVLNQPAILLFGSHDVRVHDNEAFQLASFHSQVIPIFLWDKRSQGKSFGVTGALEVVLKDALQNLKKKLQNHDLDLICRNTSDIGQELLTLCSETGAKVVYLNKEHVTESRIREENIHSLLKANDVCTVLCNSSLLYDPTKLSLSTGFNGGHWGTLMPFLKACKKQLGEPRRPIAHHETFSLLDTMKGPKSWPHGVDIDELDLAVVSGKDKWDLAILERFSMSEEDAKSQMEAFMKKGFLLYEQERSRADLEQSTSKLSPHLRLGTLSPNELYYKVESSSLSYEEKKTFARRLFWRDLAYYHLLNFPDMRELSIRSHYEKTEWCSDEEEKRRFEAWKAGMTGYPLVDAGMRELYKTGWLTQSLRMVVASFLTEYLRVNWVKGCEW